MKFASLYVIYGWDCDNCGRENLIRAHPATLTAEELRLKTIHDIDEGEESEVVLMPNICTCKFCGESYKTLDESIHPPAFDE